MRNIVVKKKKGEHKGKFVFLWTNRVVKESTAKRYNNAYNKLLSEGFKPDEITVNMLHGNWYLTRQRYKGTKKMRTDYIKWDKLSVKTRKMMEKNIQLKKTKAGKKTVYYSPTTGKVVKQRTAQRLKKYSFKVCKDVKVHLYRTSVDNGTVSHVLVWNVHDIYGSKVRWTNIRQFEKWYRESHITEKLDCIAKAVSMIAKRHKFDGSHGRVINAQVMGSIRTRRKIPNTRQWAKAQGTFSQHLSKNKKLAEYIYEDLEERMDDIRTSLQSQETQGSDIGGILLVRIYYFVKTSIPSDGVRALAQFQKGIYNVR